VGERSDEDQKRTKKKAKRNKKDFGKVCGQRHRTDKERKWGGNWTREEKFSSQDPYQNEEAIDSPTPTKKKKNKGKLKKRRKLPSLAPVEGGT